MRRARGVLEAEVLAVLWASDSPLSPEAVRCELGDDLAYTTVMTILARLHEKGAVRREAHGRGYAYAPLLDEAGLAAQRMRALLDGEDDRAGVLSRFVAGLDDSAQAAVRRALDAPGGARREPSRESDEGQGGG
jgi:predicted transcriptional regulator